MTRTSPTTIAEYIEAAPLVSQPHLRKLYAILKSVAPKAEEAIKWGNPFFVEPRFLFAFSAHKTHLSLAPVMAVMDAHRNELNACDTTRHMLRLPYDQPIPEALVRKIAKRCVQHVKARHDDGFW